MTGVRALVKDRAPSYRTIEEMIAASSEAVSPPERLTVPEAAAKYVRIKEKNYTGPWSPDKTPYLVEPQEVLMSLDYTGMVFVGPARTGKSQMFLNWLATTAICDPMDMMLVHMTQATARTWSLQDLGKLIRNSPEVKKRLTPGRQNDNVFDKSFLSGMRLEIVWPTISHLSGKTVGRNWIMDYDRLPADIDGEGDPWTLTKKRSQTLKRYGMTVAETSPGFPITTVDGQWTPQHPHEAPPCEGLLSVYNQGDRRRWYWRCPQCREAFEPHRRYMKWPKSFDPMESAEQVVLVCPHDGFPITPDFQYELNLGGRWLKQGEMWLPDYGKNGRVVGQARRSDIASFWMFGAAAAFTTWPELVVKYLNAEAEYERTGSEEKLKAVINTDFGEPHLPKALEASRLPDELKKRARPYSSKGEVPPGVCFLITTIDVQAGGRPSFVVHTYGIDQHFDVWHVDMWKIRKSRRLDEDGERKLIDPAAYPEDWECLIDEVIEKTYPLSDGSGRHMEVKLVACDSGGAAASGNMKKKATQPDGPVVSVTSNAYAFWRRLRDDQEARGYHRRFHLLKGSPSKDGSTPDIVRSFPDAQQKDRFAIARGDVPVWLINSNQVKDQVANRLGRTEPGGMIHFPQWFDDEGNAIDVDWLYTQLTTEVRTPHGWENKARRKNEAFDLLAYAIAFCKHPDIRFLQIDWDKPQPWANPDWDQNELVVYPGGEKRGKPAKPALSIEDLAEQLA